MPIALPIPGRTYDATVLRADVLRQPLAVLGGGAAESATGPYKLVQRVLLELLTRRGSMTMLPDRGSSLLAARDQGLLRTDLDVYQQFAFAAAEVRRNILADQLATDPADERLANIELAGIAFVPGNLALNIRIETAAGTGILVQAPIPTSP